MSNINTFASYISKQQKNLQFSNVSSLKEFQSFQQRKYVVLPPGSFDEKGNILSTEHTKAHGLVPGSRVSTGTGSAPDNDVHTLIHVHGLPKRPHLGQHKDHHQVVEQGYDAKRLDDFADKLNSQ